MANETNKMNSALAKSEALSPSYKALVQDYIKFFKKEQGAFTGEKKTYEAKEGTIDEPSKRGNRLVSTTVDEKLQYFSETTADYLDTVLAIEHTNASGVAKAELIVDGKSWGEFTSLELLRLKSFVEHADFKNMLADIPVRSDSEQWDESNNEMYADRAVFETPLLSGVNKTTEKESYILPDPHPEQGRPPQVGVKTTTVELGDYTSQRFSGEWTQRQRAAALSRRSILLASIAEALKKANDVPVEKSKLSGSKVLNFVFKG